MFAVDIATPPSWWLAAAGAHDDEAAENEKPISLVKSRVLKVLVVEDEFFIALDIEAQVQALGHSVIGVAVSAEQALSLTEREHPDVVLMDIHLASSIDGIEAATKIRELYGTQSIFVTANTDPLTLRRAKAINPVGVLEKPLTIEKLRSLLECV
jgi:CheY-like chemotaxis protein